MRVCNLKCLIYPYIDAHLFSKEIVCLTLGTTYIFFKSIYFDISFCSYVTDVFTLPFVLMDIIFSSKYIWLTSKLSVFFARITGSLSKYTLYCVILLVHFSIVSHRTIVFPQ